MVRAHRVLSVSLLALSLAVALFTHNDALRADG